MRYQILTIVILAMLNISQARDIHIDVNEGYDSIPSIHSTLNQISSFDSTALQKAGNIVLNNLSDQGFPFASIRFLKGSSSASADTLKVQIQRGNLWKTGGLLLDSAMDSQRLVVQRLSMLEPSEPFSFNKMDLAIERLERTGYYFFETEPYVARDSLRHILYPVLKIRDAAPGSLAGLVSYQGDQQQNLEGQLNISLYNILGTARDFALNYESSEDFLFTELDYKEPWLGPLDLRIRFKGGLSRERLGYSRDYAEIGLERDLNFRSHFGVYGGTDVISAGADLNEVPVYGQWGRSEYLYSSFNKRVFPTRGGSYFTSVRFLKKEYADTLNTLLPWEIAVENKYSLWISNVLTTKLRMRSFLPHNPAKIHIADFYRTGGSRELKGFRENSFRSHSIINAMISWSFLLDTQSAFQIFSELGWVAQEDRRTKGNLVFSAGPGWEQRRRNWSIGFFLASSSETQQIGDVMVHLLLKNHF
jgi:hypothetical protein